MHLTYLNKSAAKPSELNFHPVIRGIAHVLSVITHPLFVPLVGTWLIITTHPFAFASFDSKALFRIYASVTTNTVILTGFTVLILKQVGFIKSIRLRTQQDRIIPYIATMTFYFWAFLVFRHQKAVPQQLAAFLLGSFLAIAIAFVSNLFLKISMHGLGMGGLLGLMFCFFGDQNFNISLPLLLIVVLCGVVGTSRLILGEHTLREIYLAILFGVIAQLIAFMIIL
jgi:hypothetical protein